MVSLERAVPYDSDEVLYAWVMLCDDAVGTESKLGDFGILETYNESCQLYVYISGITGKSCAIRFQRGTICLGYVG